MLLAGGHQRFVLGMADFTAKIGIFAGDNVKQRGFASAVPPQKTDRFVVGHPQLDIGQQRLGANRFLGNRYLQHALGYHGLPRSRS